MSSAQPPPEGVIVNVEVLQHQRWGLEVRVLGMDTEVRGVVDIMYVTNDRPYNPPTDYPSVGSIREAVVMHYMPNGQLRLSLRESDLGPARRGEGLPE